MFILEANNYQRFKESRRPMQNFIPMMPATILSITKDSARTVNRPEIIRISLCYTMFGDLDKALNIFVNNVRLQRLAKTTLITSHWGSLTNTSSSYRGPFTE